MMNTIEQNARKARMWERKAAELQARPGYNVKLYCACLDMAESYRKAATK